MTVDSGGQELVVKTTPREVPKPTIDQSRLDLKMDSALAVSGGKIGSEKLAESSRQKARRVERLIGQDPQLYLDGSSKEEIVVDANGRSAVPESFSTGSQEVLLGNYLSTEIVISALYTSTPVVESLPPDSFAIPEAELARSIDANGIVLTAVGMHAPNVRTRIFTIPGQQFDSEKKPIPIGQQKVLLVQDVPVGDGKTRRIYAVSTQEAVADNISDHVARIREAQDKNPSKNTGEEGSQIEQGQTPVQNNNEVALNMRYIGLLADNVLSGRTQPAALQTYVEYALGKGVPRELIDLALQSKGIPVRRLNSSGEKADIAEMIGLLLIN